MEFAEKIGQALESLEMCCREHRESQQRIENTASKDILADLLGYGSQRDQGALLKVYWEKIEERVNELCAALEDCSADERDAAARQGVEPLLFYPDEQGRSGRDILYIALEGLAMPLLPLMQKATLIDLTRCYLERNPKRRMMPKQEELYRAMVRLSK